ncbi:MAG: hypothetical protein WA865_18020 [Spirulinaceae cyanobacterium]
MGASEEFQKQLQGGNFAEALAIAANEATELEIITWVSSQQNHQTSLTSPPPENCLHTRINLLDAAIENEIGNQFLAKGHYQELEEFHLQQVKEGRQIMQQNLESLQEIYLALAIATSETSDSESLALLNSGEHSDKLP